MDNTYNLEMSGSTIKAILNNAFNKLDSNTLSNDKILISDSNGKIISSNTNANKLVYLNNLDNDVISLLNAKADLSGATFTGTVKLNGIQSGDDSAVTVGYVNNLLATYGELCIEGIKTESYDNSWKQLDKFNTELLSNIDYDDDHNGWFKIMIDGVYQYSFTTSISCSDARVVYVTIEGEEGAIDAKTFSITIPDSSTICNFNINGLIAMSSDDVMAISIKTDNNTSATITFHNANFNIRRIG